MEAEIERLKHAEEREHLLGQRAGAAQDEVKGNDDYLEAANRVQDQTEESLGRTMQLVEASKEVGQSTLEELQQQQSQLQSITDDVGRIEDNLARADKLIRNFTKRMMTDKLIQLFAFVNFLALFVVRCCSLSLSRQRVCARADYHLRRRYWQGHRHERLQARQSHDTRQRRRVNLMAGGSSFC